MANPLYAKQQMGIADQYLRQRKRFPGDKTPMPQLLKGWVPGGARRTAFLATPEGQKWQARQDRRTGTPTTRPPATRTPTGMLPRGKPSFSFRSGAPYGPAAPRRRFSIADTLRKLPSTSDFGAQAEKAQQAFYDKGFKLLDPKIQRRRDALETKLVNRGVAPGGELWGGEMGRNEEDTNQLLENLALSSVEAGNKEHQRLTSLAAALQGQEFGQNYDTARFQSLQDQNIADALDRFTAQKAGFGEGQRKFDMGFGLARDQFGEGQRRFDMGYGLDRDRLGFDRDQFNEAIRRFNMGHDLDRDKLGYHMTDTDRRFRAQLPLLQDTLFGNAFERAMRQQGLA